MAWMYLLIASLFQVGWTVSLKCMDIKKVMAIRWGHFFDGYTNLFVLIPFLGNILCGLVNVFCFSAAIKSIPTAIALAIWMGITLIGVSIVDMMVFCQPFNWYQLFFLLVILGGIIGLKLVA